MLEEVLDFLKADFVQDKTAIRFEKMKNTIAELV